MKILQINILYKEKSTGRTCWEVEKALLAQGHSVLTAYGKGPKYASPYAYRIDTPLEYYIHNLLSRITGLQGYFSYFATKRLIRKIKQFSPDVIHLRNLHANYLNLPLLFKFLKEYNKPVIQNLHDLWAYTGKCAYYTVHNCHKFQQSCGNCKYLHQYPTSYFFDWTRKMLKDKKKGYAGIKNLTIVGVSKWVKEQSQLSFFKGRPATYIYNWIDLNTFYPHPQSEHQQIKGKYGIAADKFIILGVSAGWTPGTIRYQDFLKLADRLPSTMQLVLIGRADKPFTHPKIHHIPFVSNLKDLSTLYSMADVFVHFSMEDTFGKVIAEAQACETPAVVYNSTACPEIVGPECGFVAPPRDIDSVYRFITQLQSREITCSGMRAWVEKNFNYKTNVAQLINLYKNLIGAAKTPDATRGGAPHGNL